MKLIATVVLVILCSCSGDNSSAALVDAPTDSPDAGGDAPVEPPPLLGELPTAFKKFPILENLRGTWSGYDPDANRALDAVTVLAQDYHLLSLYNGSDSLSSDAVDSRVSYLNSNVYPSFYLNGELQIRDELTSALEAELAKIPQCGLAIDARDASAVTVSVSCPTVPQSDLSLSLWVVESEAIADQRNYLNTQSDHPYFGAGDPIVDFVHKSVVRGFASNGAGGEVIDVSAGNVVETTFSVDLTLCDDASECNLVAFVSEKNASDKFFLNDNARAVKVGEVAGWVAAP